MRRDEILGAINEITTALFESGLEAQLTQTPLPLKQDIKWNLSLLTAIKNTQLWQVTLARLR